MGVGLRNYNEVRGTVLFPNSAVKVVKSDRGKVVLTRTTGGVNFGITTCYANRDIPALSRTSIGVINHVGSGRGLRSFTREYGIIACRSRGVTSRAIRFLRHFAGIPRKRRALRVARSELLRQTFFRRLGIGVTPCTAVIDLSSVCRRVNSVKCPYILGPVRGNFNGEQRRVVAGRASVTEYTSVVSFKACVLRS